MTLSTRAWLSGNRGVLPLAVTLLAALVPARALARAGGIATSGCVGCHGGSDNGQLSMTTSPAVFNPGDRVELTLNISGGYANGGVYLNTDDVGELQAIANQGLTEVSSGLVHNQPKPGSGGTVQFHFAWVAPTTPGSVRFYVYALGGDNNGRSSGDVGMDGVFDFVYGCTGKTYYMDSDADGVGRDSSPLLGCDNAPPPGYAAVGGDCEDFRKTTFPGAPELCNLRDDDCDGQIDEDAVPVELWPDADDDGYYDERTEKVGEPTIGCAGLEGWAAYSGDCRPEDANVHPEAEEVCNSIDDDCDGNVDERVRPTCGEGWCRREAPGCDVALCVPGEPRREECNFLDDDCDGLTDEDLDLCPVGQTCAAGMCVDSDTVALDPSTPSGGAASAAGGGSSADSSQGAGAAGGGTSTASGGTSAADGSSSATGGGSSADSSQGAGESPKVDSSGCALGGRTGDGPLAVLGSLMAVSLLRRRRSSSRWGPRSDRTATMAAWKGRRA